MQRGGKKGRGRGEVLFSAQATYPGDGTVVIEEVVRAKRFKRWHETELGRPNVVLGTFEPLAAK